MLYKKKKQSEKKVTRIIAMWLSVLVCLGTLVVGQEGQLQNNAVVLDSASELMPMQGGMGGQAIQSLSFKKDMTITDALRFLGMKYQKNIVPTPRVDGIITVTNLYDVTFEEALQAVIGTNRYEIQGNFIMVYTPEEYDQIKADKRRQEFRYFTLYYLSAVEAKKMVQALLSADGTIAESSQAQSGIPSSDSISGDSGGDNLAYQDTIVVKDYPENIQRVEELLQRLDVRPLQVLVEATILSATLTEDMDFGIDWNLAAGTSITKSNVMAGGIPGTPMEATGLATGTSGLRVGITGGDISVFITALEEVTDVTVMANPKILAINKQLGQVYIGTKLGYREGDTITDGGATQEGSVKFLDTGTKLAFRPYIGNDGYIRMDIHPKDSTGNLNSQGVPDEVSAELRTNIIVKDGETIVIGGLFRDQIDNTRNQVPLLGNIPVIGEVFKGVNDTVKRQEVIVLLTPHIISDPSEMDGDAREADIQRMRYGARDRLSWLGTARLAEDSYSRAVEQYNSGDLEAAMQELNWTLHLRPTYLEAVRLRDRIVSTYGSPEATIERIMLQAIEKEEAEKWLRH